MQNAERGNLFRGHLDKIEANLVLLGIEVASLEEDLLLLLDGGFQCADPGQNVTMGNGQLISLAYLDERIEGRLVLRVRELKGELLNLKLSLEEVHRVLYLWSVDAMHRYSVLIKIESCLCYLFVHRVDQGIKSALQLVYGLYVLLMKSPTFLINEVFHVVWVLEQHRITFLRPPLVSF